MRPPRRVLRYVVAGEGVGAADGLAEGLADALAEADGMGDGVGDAVGVTDADVPGEGVGVKPGGNAPGGSMLGPPPMTEQPARMTAPIRIDDPRRSESLRTSVAVFVRWKAPRRPPA